MSDAGDAALTARPPPLPLPVAAAAAGALLLWSGTAIANKIAVGHMDAMTAGILRSMLAGLIAAGVALACRFPFPRIGRQRGLLVLSGVASFAAWPMLLSLGLGRTTANHAGLIMAMIPVFTGLIAAAFERRWPRLGWWVGVALALVGTFFLVFHRGDGTSDAGEVTVLGDLIVLSGVVICALGYVTGGKLSPVIGTWATTFWGLALACLVLVPAFALLAERTDWSAVGSAGWLAIAYMTFLSSLLGYAAWFWALGHGGIARIGSWQFAQPVMTLGFAALILAEAITLPLLISAAAILAGTAIAQRQAAR
ncbi:MAG: DMT family transporter [Alphaproteobacteria bacterium]|nr:DMT family transporter [Alphaproteobacteria bacterium]